ncbi:MAG: Sulfoacetaldehyde acetyltransferase [Alphaproteobacteria bacterium MarineAlpha5_Bin5]|nr:MAG: Sulfoacetaldehyde acetyltransferase [Alphaproteobacteria bacterium MarineAlpha5_Bin4]PPR50425.1 MAG: Sulfoacetaldehyde acetyltransferase [Alphaproteobacteria bacterium MarineAlpha5_Bin5]|tara:strand:- start:8313 stop:10007 length:1695 start_codon:yes stop_codon:yes gene_type:complete
MKKEINRPITGGKAVIECLKAHNIKYVFGLIGSATMEIFDALYDEESIRFIDVRDERTGAHMADAFARASGNHGVIIAGQNGPGATNLVTGVAQAKAAFSPLLSIAGAISTDHQGKDAFQDIDQQKIFEPITKKTFSINHTKSIVEDLNKALYLAMQEKWGPVHVNIPRDILAGVESFKSYIIKDTIENKNVDEKDIEKISLLIDSSSKPVIICGAGIKNSNSQNEIISLSKKLNIPIVSSAGHGDVIPSDYELYAGQMGPRGNKIASSLVKNADLILAIGTRLGFNSTFYSYDNISKFAKIVQVDIDPIALGRYFPIEVGINNDAKIFLENFISFMSRKDFKNNSEIWIKKFLKEKAIYYKKRDENADVDSKIIQPSGLFKELRDIMPKNASVTLDAGTLCLQATDQFNFFETRSLFTPLDFGLVGFSFAAGLGVKLAKPDSPVFSLMGDGGFGMTVSELSTAVHHKINTITIIMNNKSWGAEKAYQRDFYDKRYIAVDISNPPFHELADIYGAKGYHITHLKNLKEAVSDALVCNKPAIINVEVDPNELYSFRKDSFTHRSK